MFLDKFAKYIIFCAILLVAEYVLLYFVTTLSPDIEYLNLFLFSAPITVLMSAYYFFKSIRDNPEEYD